MFCFCMFVTERLEICSRAGDGLDDLQRVPVNLSTSSCRRHIAKINTKWLGAGGNLIYTQGWGRRAKSKRRETSLFFCVCVLLSLMLLNQSMSAPWRNEHRMGDPVVWKKWRAGFQQGTYIIVLSTLLNNTYYCAFLPVPLWGVLNSSVTHFNSTSLKGHISSRQLCETGRFCIGSAGVFQAGLKKCL